MGAGEPQERSRSSKASPGASAPLLPQGAASRGGAGALPAPRLRQRHCRPCKQPADTQLSVVPLSSGENKLEDLAGASPLEISSSESPSVLHISPRKEGTASVRASPGSGPVGELGALRVFPLMVAHIIHGLVHAPYACT